MFEKRNRYNKKLSTKSLNILQKSSKVLLALARIILGLVFLFSGFVKAIDPLGNTYKIQDYLNSFGEQFSQFSSLSLLAAIALSTLELLIGLCFLFKIKLKATSIIALLFMLIMLPLTLYIAIYNPVTDCGCFGEALKITNWETFFKNVILLILIIIIIIFHKKIRNLFLPGVEWMIILIFILGGIGLSVYSYRHLPMIDFLPYKIGVNIPEAMKIPEGKPTDTYETKLIYEKNGVKQEFTLENYPKDSTWKFVDQKTTLIAKGYVPPIHNFTIEDTQGNNLVDEIINYQGVVYLVIMNDINKTSKAGIDKAEILYEQSKQRDERFYALVGSSKEDVERFVKQTKVTFPFYNTDAITLKTIIRANPGFVKIKNGIIIEKWNWRDFQ